MDSKENKRAKIIEAQAARERSASADGKAQPIPKPRSNWAATPPLSPPRRRWNKPPRR